MANVQTIYFMHKDILVAELDYNLSSKIITTLRLYNKQHLPVGTRNPKTGNLIEAFNAWFKNRCIPYDRPDTHNIFFKSEYVSYLDLMKNNFLCSLTDCYWFKTEDTKDFKWNDVNFFNNDFTSNLGEKIFFDSPVEINNYNSPDITTAGALPKYWFKNTDNQYYLLKDSFRRKDGYQYYNEPVCEVFTSELMKLYNLPVTPYFFTTIYNKLYCACPNFIDNDMKEFVSMEMVGQEVGGSKRKAYETFCELGFKKEMDQITLIDYLIGNGDRHHNNIGYIRNPDTLQIIGLAPCFDSGGGMAFDYDQGIAVEKAGSKLYYRDEEESLSLIDDFSWFINSSITCDDICNLYYSLSTGYIDESVINLVIQKLRDRYNFLIQYIKEKETL